MKRVLMVVMITGACGGVFGISFERQLFSTKYSNAKFTDTPYINYRTFLWSSIYSYGAFEFVHSKKRDQGFNLSLFFLQNIPDSIGEFDDYKNDPMVTMAEYFFSFYTPGEKRNKSFFTFGLGFIVGVTIDWDILSLFDTGTFSIQDIQSVDYMDVPAISIISVPFFSFRGIIKL